LLIEKLIAGAVLLAALTACSATDPAPSPLFDGQYVGTRQSNLTEQCGITQLHGATSAHVKAGRIAMPLFSPNTRMTGTVGEDGRVRASGLWPNPTGGFPGMTVLNGTISQDTLTGTATDFRCNTDIHLHRIKPVPKPAVRHDSGHTIHKPALH
jgi:hypothetical protein